jgi:hypothetical protein
MISLKRRSIAWLMFHVKRGVHLELLYVKRDGPLGLFHVKHDCPRDVASCEGQAIS